MARRADPFARLLDVVDQRARKARPAEATMGTITNDSPAEVTLDFGAVVPSPVIAGCCEWAVGDRVLCIPLQGGHDWAILPTTPIPGSS
jgi:hypothetical protein